MARQLAIQQEEQKIRDLDDQAWRKRLEEKSASNLFDKLEGKIKTLQEEFKNIADVKIKHERLEEFLIRELQKLRDEVTKQHLA